MNFNNHVNKREIQKQLFPFIRQKRIICLGGPQLGDYVKLFPNGIEHITSYQYIQDKSDRDVIFQQIRGCQQYKHVDILIGNIAEAPIDKDIFYDLDFCGTIVTSAPIIKRFKSCKFMCTLSMRGKWNELYTIKHFFKAVGEQIKENNISPEGFLFIHTNRNIYLVKAYKETHSPIKLLTFFKL